MKYTEYEKANIRTKNRPYFAELLIQLNELIGDDWDIVVRVFKPKRSFFQNSSNPSQFVDLTGINKRTALILWGDEYSQIFPESYYRAAGVVIKCYCPDAWKDRLIPVTDIALSWTPEIEICKPTKCSSRAYPIMFSANLNYRRLDIYRGLIGRSYGYPFRLSSNYPITGRYPFLHKVEAVMMHRIITGTGRYRGRLF